jgi:Flp pilus assembly pilin Flp
MPSRRGSRLVDDSGQGLVEYALILALASLGMVFALVVLQDSIGNSMLGSSRQIVAASTGEASTQLLRGGPSGGGAGTGDEESP